MMTTRLPWCFSSGQELRRAECMVSVSFFSFPDRESQPVSWTSLVIHCMSGSAGSSLQKCFQITNFTQAMNQQFWLQVSWDTMHIPGHKPCVWRQFLKQMIATKSCPSRTLRYPHISTYIFLWYIVRGMAREHRTYTMTINTRQADNKAIPPGGHHYPSEGTPVTDGLFIDTTEER